MTTNINIDRHWSDPLPRPFAHGLLGGTFEAMHDGHKEYLLLGLLIADFIDVVVTDAAFVSDKKTYVPSPAEDRCVSIHRFLIGAGFDASRYTTIIVSDDASITTLATRPQVDLVVCVSDYEAEMAARNRARARDGLPTFSCLVKPPLCRNGVRLSSTDLVSAQTVERYGR